MGLSLYTGSEAMYPINFLLGDKLLMYLIPRIGGSFDDVCELVCF